MSALSDFDWNNAIKTFAVSFTAQIPAIGVIVSSLVAIFWPDGKTDVWSQIKDKVKVLVDQEIVNFAISLIKADLQNIKLLSSNYNHALGNQKGNILDIIISSCMNLYTKLNDLDRRKFFLPFISAAGSMHLLFLIQRLNYGDTLFNPPNVQLWREQLNAYDSRYRSLIVSSFSEWKQWFPSQINADYGQQRIQFIPLPTHYAWGKIENLITGETINLRQDMNSVNDYYKRNCIYVKQRMINDAVHPMIESLIGFYYVSSCLDIHNKSLDLPDSLTTFELGPWGPNLQSSNISIPIGDLKDCKISGLASQIQVRYYNSIDGIGFKGNGEYKFDGDQKGGKSSSFNISNKKGQNINGMTLILSKGVCAGLKIHYQEGADVEGIGNFGNWEHSDWRIQSKVPDFLLNGAELQYGAGYSNGIRAIRTVKLSFKYRPKQK